MTDERSLWLSGFPVKAHYRPQRPFSRIRNEELNRFTVDRLMSIINRLGSRIEVKIKVRPGESDLRQVSA